jgi:hypothetical protein
MAQEGRVAAMNLRIFCKKKNTAGPVADFEFVRLFWVGLGFTARCYHLADLPGVQL